MGHEAFLELRRRSPEYAVKLLLRPSKVNKKMFAPYAGETNWLEIVWGDLTDPDDVKRAVSGVDYVLHPAAMISPAADHYPEMARKVNFGGTKNLVDAIKSEPDGIDRIRFVFIGSVAQYGDRLPPIEMIKVGDPLKPSVYDYYALTKCDAETMVVESGLKYWASMRQTFICIPNLLTLLDPIVFHQPLEQRIEFITSRDAGFGLVQCLEARDTFWQRIYNMSGGPSCRIRYADFMNTIFGSMGMGCIEDLFERNWFALRNFHCGYYEDSWELNEELSHFRDTKEDFFQQVEQATSTWMKLGARIGPSFVVKRLARRFAEPMDWIANNDEGKINAFFGSKKAWEEIPGWDGSYRR
jgi:nucleoside-diphosphate-sugar epimerase